ncbi:MAG: N-acetyltransferase [Kordiimonadaceae bacterium]|nr:N-acetyltransferase [Kordiimonadaceae bacterium]
MTSPKIEIKCVQSKADRKAFVKVLWKIFKGDPKWIPPLIMERMDAIDENKNPYFQHAQVQFWIAYKDDEPVGRISAQIDELVEKHHGIKTGHYGFFDCINDQDVANALFDTAFSWLKKNGMVEVIGPFSLSINEETGMLVEGFDTYPHLLMGHAIPYYQDLVANYGLKKVKDTWAYTMDISSEFLPPVMQKLVDRAVDRGQVVFRPINMDKYEEELKLILDIFNDAWIDNWKFIPFTQAELDHTVKEMKLIIREDFTYIAEIDGVPQAMMVTLPNINEIIRDLDGKVFPFGFLKLLWRLKIKPSFKTVRVPLMGVRKEYQNSRLSGIMSFGLFEACRKSAAKVGCNEAELSWVLEENTRLSKLLETIGCVKYKTYRLFHKEL